MKPKISFVSVMAAMFVIFTLFISCEKTPENGKLDVREIEQLIYDNYQEQIKALGYNDEETVTAVTLKETQKKNPSKYQGQLALHNNANGADYDYDLFATYDVGKTLEYRFVVGEMPEIYTLDMTVPGDNVAEAEAEEELIPKKLDVYSFDTFTGDVDVIHVKIPKNSLPFLRKVFEIERGNDFSPQNLFIPKSSYTSMVRIVTRGYSEETFDQTQVGLARMFRGTATAINVSELRYLSVDNFPESIYPVRMRNAEKVFKDDIRASILFIFLLEQTGDIYRNALNDGDFTRMKRQLNRLKSSLDGGNKALFKAAFPDLERNRKVTYKGFIQTMSFE
jgi:hypothetical protein